jgi:hypothetical protein
MIADVVSVCGTDPGSTAPTLGAIWQLCTSNYFANGAHSDDPLSPLSIQKSLEYHYSGPFNTPVLLWWAGGVVLLVVLWLAYVRWANSGDRPQTNPKRLEKIGLINAIVLASSLASAIRRQPTHPSPTSPQTGGFGPRPDPQQVNAVYPTSITEDWVKTAMTSSVHGQQYVVSMYQHYSDGTKELISQSHQWG